MRVLVLTPWVPYPVTGACQQDRFHGLRQMRDLGYELQVLARIHSFQDRGAIEKVFRGERIPLALFPHTQRPWSLLLRRLPHIVTQPALLDGAALEYVDPAYERLVLQTIDRFRPDVVWIEYTVLWPLLRLLRSSGVPMIMKSSLNEAEQCLGEHGRSLLARLKAVPKLWTERIAARESDLILALTPQEETWYRRCGARRTGVLPLRGLSQCFTQREHHEKHVIDVVFLSSNYSMGHNRDALQFLLQQIVPRVRGRSPGRFRFHITGKKFPDSCRCYLRDDVRVHGFVEDLATLLVGMDVAVSPWVGGAGMQQKVFEPLCRSIPVVTNHVAGFPLHDGVEFLHADRPEEYVEKLLELDHADRRNALAAAAYAKAQALFSEEVVKRIVTRAIDAVARV